MADKPNAKHEPSTVKKGTSHPVRVDVAPPAAHVPPQKPTPKPAGKKK